MSSNPVHSGAPSGLRPQTDIAYVPSEQPVHAKILVRAGASGEIATKDCAKRNGHGFRQPGLNDCSRN
jgi:hypothetical protein